MEKLLWNFEIVDFAITLIDFAISSIGEEY